MMNSRTLIAAGVVIFFVGLILIGWNVLNRAAEVLEARLADWETAVAGNQAFDAEFDLVLAGLQRQMPETHADFDTYLDGLGVLADYRVELPRSYRNSSGMTFWTPWRLMQVDPATGRELTRWEGEF